MAGMKEIRGKIKSVQNTRKITKAMEMVAASKMRRAQERMRAARPYADKVRDTATFAEPRQTADGIDAVWVNGVLSYLDGAVTGLRAGHFVARGEGSRLDALGHF